jgi:hypothetical protein
MQFMRCSTESIKSNYSLESMCERSEIKLVELGGFHGIAIENRFPVFMINLIRNFILLASISPSARRFLDPSRCATHLMSSTHLFLTYSLAYMPSNTELKYFLSWIAALKFLGIQSSPRSQCRHNSDSFRVKLLWCQFFGCLRRFLGMFKSNSRLNEADVSVRVS